jgi:uncharacterized membrane protein YkvA (DUF1232 family)
MGQRGTRPGVGRGGAAAGKRTGSRRRPKRSGTNLLTRRDIEEFVREHGARIAAPDVAVLVTDAARLRAKAAALRGARYQPLRRQIRDALDCLDDYFAGRCLQIPYYTVAVLAAALFYFRRPLDAVPDFLPELGALDDALVMAVATEVAADGLSRYRTWKSADRERQEQEATTQGTPGQVKRGRRRQ